MNRSPIIFLSIFALIIVLESSCSSGKSALQHGNYYDAVITSINRLRRNTDNKKSSETLRAAYPMAVKYYEDRANSAIASNAPYKWREVVQHYSTLNSMHDEVQRSPGALRVIPNPINYQSKLADARQQAAEESYREGVMTLGMGDRVNARKAYYLFIDANNYVLGYKDVQKLMADALWAGTVKVAVEPIPVVARNYAVDAQYLDSKINEYLSASQPNEFVKFYRMAEVGSQRFNPDHIVQLTFDEFSIGQVYMNEKESQVEKDSVVVALTYTDTKGIFLKKDTEVPKIIPPVVDKGQGAPTGGDVHSGKVDDKKVPDTKSTDVDQQNKPDEKLPDSKGGDKNLSDNKSDDKKPVDKKNDGPGEGDKKPENKDANNKDNPTGKKDDKADEGKSTDDKTNGSDKNDYKKDESGKTGEEQVTICHQPPGKPEERKTLVVPQSAVKAHLAHGDVLGTCRAENKEDKSKSTKGKDGGGGMAFRMPVDHAVLPVMLASASDRQMWYLFQDDNAVMDTTKIFGKVKATVRHFKKTITSRGVLNLKIIDAKTGAVISEQRLPSESVWISEWLTYNGDSRALTPDQARLAKQRESPTPTNQDLFAEFSKPLYDQITNAITTFYRNY